MDKSRWKIGKKRIGQDLLSITKNKKANWKQTLLYSSS